jgi:hypothetical protein
MNTEQNTLDDSYFADCYLQQSFGLYMGDVVAARIEQAD